jgi:hypothetical protein
LYLDPDVIYEMTQDFRRVVLSAFQELFTDGVSVPGFVKNAQTTAQAEKLAEDFFEFGD